MRRRLTMLMPFGLIPLALTLAPTAAAAQVRLAGGTPISRWAQYDNEWRVASVNGAIAVLNAMDASCTRDVTTAEVTTTMYYGFRTGRYAGDVPWIVVMLMIMSNDYGCRVEPDGLRTFINAMNRDSN